RGEASQTFAKLLETAYNVPVVLWDERLTTMAAEKMLIAADVSRQKRKKVIDKMAAVMILQGYLDSLN
ncbi:Holliday junction resolvase RuvX, partial [Bacillus velezensis]